jgi:hypothetical protein
MLRMSDATALVCSHRAPDDDFFCEKYGVWYPLRDCNFRVMHRTYEGCVDCFQGRVNLRRTRTVAAEAAGPADLLRFPSRKAAPSIPVPGAAPRKR